MFVLKIILWVILAILGIILLLLILPVSGKISYIDKKLSYSVKYAFFNIYDSDGKGLAAWFMNRRKRKKPPEDEEDYIADEDDETFFEESESPDYEISEAAEEAETAQEAEVSEENIEDEAVSGEPESAEDDTESDGTDISEEEQETENAKKRTLGEKIEFILNIWEIADRPILKIFKGFKFSDLYIDFAIGNEDAYKCALNYGRICGGVYNILAWMGVAFTVKYKTVDIFPDFDAKESRYDAAVTLSFNFMNIIIAALWFAVMYIFKIFIPNKKKKKQK